MPSDHARIRRDIWADSEWRQLSIRAQWLYMHLLSSPTLNLCGVADWRPNRIAKLCGGATGDDITAISVELIQGEFILPDFDTEEVLIRSWAKHDGLLAHPNMGIAFGKAWREVTSEPLRGLIITQLIRLHDVDPDLPGFRKLQDLLGSPSLTFREALERVMPHVEEPIHDA